MTPLRLCQINDVKLTGRLTHDPELKFTAKGHAVCKISIAVNRYYKDSNQEWKEQTSFIPAVVWQETAQLCEDRLKKGSPIYLEGRLKSRSWEDKEGKKRTSIEVDVRKIQFLSKLIQPESETTANPVLEPESQKTEELFEEAINS